MTKSSAYKSEFNFAPFGKTKGSDRIFSKKNEKSFIKRLNSNGLKIQPWRTPLAYEKEPCLILAKFYGACRVRIKALN